MQVLWWNVKASPPWLLATQYLLLTSYGTAAACSFLLRSQVLSIMSGLTYLEALQLQQAGGRPGTPAVQLRPPIERIRDLFGDGHPMLWLLPRWHEPTRTQKYA